MATGSFPRAHAFSAGSACPVLHLGGSGSQSSGSVTLFPLAKLGDRISSRPSVSRLSKHPYHPGEGPGQGLLGICPRLFPWILWEEIQRKTESVPAEREGKG